jgi:predicted CoA-binding protein
VGTIGRLQNQIGVRRRGPRPDGNRLLIAEIDPDIEFSLVFRLQKANHPIVLELLADGPHEDWAQQNLRNARTVRNPAEVG